MLLVAGLGVGTALVDVAPAHAVGGPTLLLEDDFQDGSVVGRYVAGGRNSTACLTASGDTGQSPIPGCEPDAIDAPGSGALRLTSAVNDRAGFLLYDKALPNDEARLRAILEELAAEHGPVLMVVDPPATIGALPVAVAEATDQVEVAYLPGLAMRRIADLHPGTAKTDARDALIIAEAARTMPHTLRDIRVDEAQIAELAVLAGFDDDLAAQITATSNRLRGMLTQIHPALERVLGPRVTHPAVADLLQQALRDAGLTSGGRTGRRRQPAGGSDGNRADRIDRELLAADAEELADLAGVNA